MVPQPLPALHQTEVAYHTIMSAAHPREPHIPEPTHDASMHWHANVSNLDVGRIKIDFHFVHRRGNSPLIVHGAGMFWL
jgi:hypothetical protein